jgi:hypothetical protein
MALALLLLLGEFGSGLFPESPTTEGDAAMQEQVERLLERRIDINRASASELLAIPWLSPFLAYRVIASRESAGGFASVEQLRRVPGMTAETFEAIRPFLRMGGRQRTWTGSAVSRAATDSVQAGSRGLSVFNRVELRSGRTRVVALTEKDRGEASAFDFLSGGAQVPIGRARITLGDFVVGFGQGLVLSAPQWRSSFLDGSGGPNRAIRLLSSAAEASFLRGGAVEVAAGSWNASLLGSHTGRDARLNADGTVSRLVGSGVHDDSASLAGRDAVREATAGLSTSYSGNRFRAGFVAGYSHYSSSFAPADTSSSFAGSELVAGGLNAGCRLGHYELGAEMAASSGLGLAGALQLTGDWQEFDSRVALRGRQGRFYAPHGRWSSLTGTKDRLDASGRLGWHHAGSSVSLSGNTYRDFDLDSVPARLVLRLGQELGRLDLGLAFGVRYQAEQERYRTARAEIGARAGRATTVRLMLADVYPERNESRGAMAALLLTQGVASAELGLAAARIVVDGSGVSMYLHEPGAGRIGSSFSTSVSCWRLSAGCGARTGRWLRLGLKAGCAWKPRAVIDGAAQLEIDSP